MAETLAAAPLDSYDEPARTANIGKWHALGLKAYASDPVKYAHAAQTTSQCLYFSGPVVDECLISLTEGSHLSFGETNPLVWNSDLPSVEYATTFGFGPHFKEMNGQMPNLVDGSYLFYDGPLESCHVDLPSLRIGNGMF